MTGVGGHEEHVAAPEQFRAGMSRITRESTEEATAKAIRAEVGLDQAGDDVDAGALAARMRWMPVARAICARRQSTRSVSSGDCSIRSASFVLVDHHDVGKRFVVAALLPARRLKSSILRAPTLAKRR